MKKRIRSSCNNLRSRKGIGGMSMGAIIDLLYDILQELKIANKNLSEIAKKQHTEERGI